MGKGLGKLIYYIAGVIILVILLTPVFLMMFGDGGVISAISTLIDAGSNGGGGDTSILVQIVGLLIGIVLVLFVLATPTESFKSPLHYSLKQTSYAIDSLEEVDKDKKQMLLYKAVAFGVLCLGVFSVYAYLIYRIQGLAMDGGQIVSLISTMFMIAVVAFGNSIGIGQLITKHGDVKMENNELKFIGPNDTQFSSTVGENNVAWVLALLVANIVFVGIGQALSTSAENYLQDSGVAPIIEGQGGDVISI